MKVLITGGCGFIGVNLVKFFLGKGYTIRILDNLLMGKKEYLNSLNLPDHPELLIGDIRDKMVDKVVEGTDAVVHLAAHTSVVESLENPQEDWDINVNGTLNLLEACCRRGVGKFIFASSSAVLGEQIPPIDETKIPQPLSPYGASKLAGEALCSSYYHSFGIKTISLRFANCYGPYSDHKPSVISRFLKWAKEGKPLIIYGDGNQTRDFINVDDVCQAIYLALTADGRPSTADSQLPQQTQSTQGTQKTTVRALPSADLWGEVFQIGTEIETSINQLAELILEIANESQLITQNRQLFTNPSEREK